MSFTIVTDVFCDLCGNWINGATGRKPERGAANKEARRLGWKVQRECGVGPFQHICPNCQKEKNRAKTTAVS